MILILVYALVIAATLGAVALVIKFPVLAMIFSVLAILLVGMVLFWLVGQIAKAFLNIRF